MDRKDWLQANYRQALSAIPDSVQLCVVSKNFPVTDIHAVYSIGHRLFAENYAKELLSKASLLPADIQWHFIGALQTKKIAKLLQLPNMACIQTVDSVAKAEEIERQCVRIGRTADIYLQVNSAREPGKHGLHPSVIEPAALHILANMHRCRLRGLMTIGSFRQSCQPAGVQNSDFAIMQQLQGDLLRAAGVQLRLSMGMSTDYRQAIIQGATLVRLGSIVFGARSPSAGDELGDDGDNKVSLM